MRGFGYILSHVILALIAALILTVVIRASDRKQATHQCKVKCPYAFYYDARKEECVCKMPKPSRKSFTQGTIFDNHKSNLQEN